MDVTINNLYFKYDQNSNCISTYDAITNNLVSYIHVNQEIKDQSSFENTCQRWASATIDDNDRIYQGVDYNSWY